MYERHFGLRFRPFRLLPDPDQLYWTRQHRRAYDAIELGLRRLSPVTVLTGDVGSGKTTLIQRFLSEAPDDAAIGLVSNYTEGGGDIARWLLMALGRPSGVGDFVERVRDLEAFCLDAYAEGRRTLLIIDEAQNVGDGDFERLRLLSNINRGKDMLLMMLLVGQPELDRRLASEAARPLRQRVGTHCRLGPLTAAETEGYVRHRVALAQGPSDLFARSALSAVHAASAGIPRLVNLVCDLCLVCGFADGRSRIDGSFAASVIDEARASGQLAFVPGRAAPEAVANPASAQRLRSAAGRSATVVDWPEKRTAVTWPKLPGSRPAPEAPETARTPSGVRADGLVDAATASIAARQKPAASSPLAFSSARAAMAGRTERDGPPPEAGLAAPGPANPARATMAHRTERDGPPPEPSLAAPGLANPARARMADWSAQDGSPSKAGPAMPELADAATAVPPGRVAAGWRGGAAAAALVLAGLGLLGALERGGETTALPLAEVAPSVAAPPAEIASVKLASHAGRGAADWLLAGTQLALDDPTAAAVAYARAALRGSARAAFFLGQVYETGSGVSIDQAAARAWYARAKDELDSAAERLAVLGASPEPGSALAPPRPLSAERLGNVLELVWSSGPGADPFGYTVELADRSGVLIAAIDVAGTAVQTPIPDAADRWRLVAGAGEDMTAASPWYPLPAEPSAQQPITAQMLRR